MENVVFAQIGIMWTATAQTMTGPLVGVGDSESEAQAALAVRLAYAQQPRAVTIPPIDALAPAIELPRVSPQRVGVASDGTSFRACSVQDRPSRRTYA